MRVAEVATVLTACGIETHISMAESREDSWLQQYLPLAVLKRYVYGDRLFMSKDVATVLTACGIETVRLLMHNCYRHKKLQQYLPFMVLKR